MSRERMVCMMVKQSGIKGLWLLAIALLAASGRAQSPAPAATWTFEVAAIKPSSPDATGGTMLFQNGTFMTKNQVLGNILKFAYNTTVGTLLGVPNWASSARFDIDAMWSESLNAELQKLPTEQQRERRREMVQALLIERFHLKVHHETRELPAYAMTVAKGGVKLKPSTHEGSGMTLATGKFEGRGVSIAEIDAPLGGQPEIRRPVLNQTGLTGKYDFVLQWTPETGASAAPGGENSATPDTSGPSLFTALQEQLGLKLEPTKAPADVVVIDHIEMPSEN